MDFQDTIPTDLPVDSRTLPLNEPVRTLDVVFTGSGSEYFRIWIVNLLLTLLTLTLYTPFARARRLAYFYANTRLDGHALGFHGNPWKMLRGYLLVAGLGAAYALAARFAPVLAAVLVLLLAALWPALWRASLQFRLANTSWRGLRFGFEGDLPGAYAAAAPLLVPAALVLAAAALLPAQAEGAAPAGVLASVLGLVLLFSMLFGLACLPWALSRMKRYQQDHLRYAGERTRLHIGALGFYGLTVKALLVAVLPLVALGTVMGLTGGGRGPLNTWVLLLGVAFVFAGVMLFYGLLLGVMLPYVVARLQNLVWNHTSSRRLAFRSELRFLPLAGLSLLNLLLMVLTLGLYRPFAAVAVARMRLQAMRVQVHGDLDSWLNQAAQRAPSTTGDAAGDFFGIDLGL